MQQHLVTFGLLMMFMNRKGALVIARARARLPARIGRDRAHDVDPLVH